MVGRYSDGKSMMQHPLMYEWHRSGLYNPERLKRHYPLTTFFDNFYRYKDFGGELEFLVPHGDSRAAVIWLCYALACKSICRFRVWIFPAHASPKTMLSRRPQL